MDPKRTMYSTCGSWKLHMSRGERRLLYKKLDASSRFKTMRVLDGPKEQKMDQKIWPRRKRYSEKSIAANNEAEISLKGNEEKKLPYEKETAQESNTGREKAEENETLVHLNAALKYCMQQLSSLKLEQDQRAKLKRTYKKLESKYTEARKKLVNLTVENAQLTKVLVTKEKIIEDINNKMSQAKHDYCVLGRDLKKRNHNADVAKVEAERQRLRLLVRKRVPVDRRMSLKIKRLCEVEEENKILKESACKREGEICFLKMELARVRCGDVSVNGVANCVANSLDKDNLDAKLLESENNIIGLKTELELVKESKRMIEDHYKNTKLINYDLDHQLSVAKVQITEALQKVSFLEMELEDRSRQCEELEATCLELQLDLVSFSGKDVVNEYVEQGEKLLQTGSEITVELTNNKNSGHCSLRDHMAMEDCFDTEGLLRPPMTKEILKETKEACIPQMKNVVPQALAIKPCNFSNKQRSALRLVL